MSQERVMLFIDADNLSLDVMEQTVRLLLNQHGGLHVRRAYCTAESAVANQAAFKRLGIKPMVNLAAGKNSTDIAMAVDAVDLVLAERPDVVVIASSDSDFAPLVHRLREKGCVVRGFGQKGKVGDETQDVYDDYTVIEHRGSSAAKAPARAAAKTARTPRTSRARATPEAAAPAVPASRAPASKAAPTRGAAGGRATAKRSPPRENALAQDAADASAIFEAIVDGALDDIELAEADPKPAAKKPARARKPAASKALATAEATPAAVDEQAIQAPVASPAPVRSRGRKPKAVAADELAAAPPEAAVVAAAAQPAPSPGADAPAAAAPDTASARHRAAAPADAAGAATPRATLKAVMACLPELERGQSLALNVAVQRLRESRLLGRNSSSLKLFSQFPDDLELLPARNPSQVRLKP
jgi:uncharacterized protein (TIGR00288 family)